jgi:outer membrane translocation and assembly module TamA
MRFPTAIPILLCLIGAALGQGSSQAPPAEVRIRSLTIVSDQLSFADRQRIVRSLQSQAYLPEEFEERVRLRLRDLGYYCARAESAQLSSLRQESQERSADVSIKVEPGAQYRLGVIEFHHATVFPPDQLRSQFPVETGDLFNATSLAYGLERLKDLYQTKGHINFGAIPKVEIDEARHVINLTIDIDEGKAYVFGQLILDGIEPHAGDGNALISSWAKLRGKSYDPELLKDWLASNWPSGKEGLNHMHAIPDEGPQQVSFRLEFQ